MKKIKLNDKYLRYMYDKYIEFSCGSMETILENEGSDVRSIIKSVIRLNDMKLFFQICNYLSDLTDTIQGERGCIGYER